MKSTGSHSYKNKHLFASCMTHCVSFIWWYPESQTSGAAKWQSKHVLAHWRGMCWEVKKKATGWLLGERRKRKQAGISGKMGILRGVTAKLNFMFHVQIVGFTELTRVNLPEICLCMRADDSTWVQRKQDEVWRPYPDLIKQEENILDLSWNSHFTVGQKALTNLDLQPSIR